MYFVVRGSLQISKHVIQGADKMIATLGAGQYAGEMGLLTGEQRSATIRALEDTEVVEIDQEAFLQLIHDQPQGARPTRPSTHARREPAHALHCDRLVCQ